MAVVILVYILLFQSSQGDSKVEEVKSEFMAEFTKSFQGFVSSVLQGNDHSGLGSAGLALCRGLT